MDLGEFDIQFNEEAMKTDFTETVAEPAHQFAAPITENEIKDLMEDQECKNTKANTRWAVGVWRKWREERNGFNTGEIFPHAACMDYWLQRFLMEVRNQRGKEYTPKSLYYVACDMLRHLRDIEIFGMNVLNPNGDIFARTRRVLDARMKSFEAQGIGTKTRQADSILPEQENVL
jgi:hypothetical protein